MNQTYSFKIVIVSENCAAAVRAQELSGRLADQFKPACEVDFAHWNFALLNYTPIRKLAANEATEADMIVFSAQWAADLPAQVKSWIEDWSPRKQGYLTAMVALLDLDVQDPHRYPPLCVYLQAAAEKCGMDFFSNALGGADESLRKIGADRVDLVDRVLVEADAAFQYGAGQLVWGING